MHHLALIIRQRPRRHHLNRIKARPIIDRQKRKPRLRISARPNPPLDRHRLIDPHLPRQCIRNRYVRHVLLRSSNCKGLNSTQSNVSSSPIYQPPQHRASSPLFLLLQYVVHSCPTPLQSLIFSPWLTHPTIASPSAPGTSTKAPTLSAPPFGPPWHSPRNCPFTKNSASTASNSTTMTPSPTSIKSLRNRSNPNAARGKKR